MYYRLEDDVQAVNVIHTAHLEGHNFDVYYDPTITSWAHIISGRSQRYRRVDDRPFRTVYLMYSQTFRRVDDAV